MTKNDFIEIMLDYDMEDEIIEYFWEDWLIKVKVENFRKLLETVIGQFEKPTFH